MTNRRRRQAPPHGALTCSPLAHAAARLMAVDGLDLAAAKRKAARRHGGGDAPLPGDLEVTEALQQHQALYQPQQHAAQLLMMRRAAVSLMRRLQPFSPWLTGAVLDGCVSCSDRIELLLYPDSAKQVEIFLLDAGIACRHEPPRNARIEAALQLQYDGVEAVLLLLPPQEERVKMRDRNGRTRARANLKAVESLCRDSEAATDSNLE